MISFNIKRAVSKIRNVICFKLPTKQHRKAWQSYQRLLAIRCNVCMVLQLICMVIQYSLGMTQDKLSRKYVEDGNAHHEELYNLTSTAIEWILILSIFGRVSLLALSYKNLSFCRAYIHYEYVLMALESVLPSAQDKNARVLFYCLILIRIIAFYSSDFKSVCITVMVPIASYECMEILHHDEDVNLMGSKILLSYTSIFAIFILLSIAIAVPGQLIVKNTVMRKGNTKVLNNLKESVIIANRNTGQLLFANQAAERLSKHCVEDLCIAGAYESLSKDKNDFSVFKCKEQQFAKLDLQKINNISNSPDSAF